MKLDPAHEAKVQHWIQDGLKLSEIQTRLADELGVKLTYMEARFLLDDLKLKPKDAPAPVVSATVATAAGPVPPAPAGKPAATGLSPLPPAATGPGGVQVGVDTVARPGAIVSGKVTFSDGQRGTWYLDQMGRLGIGAETPGYKPTQADLADFQAQLDAELARAGF